MLRRAEQAVADEVSGPRHFSGWQLYLVLAIATSWSLFQLATGKVLVLNSSVVRSVHLAFALALAFVSFPLIRRPSSAGFLTRLAPRDRFHPLDLILAAVAAFAALYVVLDYDGLAARIGHPLPRDRVVGIALMLLLLEGGRRVLGLPLPTIATVMSSLAFLGPYLPSAIAFRGVSLDRFLGQITLSNEGIFGIPLGVSANIVFLFVLFGAMLERAGGGAWFIQLATSLLGAFRGGPAKACVVASGLVGMVSGSSVANAVTAGTLTIPLMKSIGYPPRKAGAIETASSVWGQLMPPIMGAAAFIMAEYLNVPYLTVVKSAIIPAILVYAAMFFIVHVEACKLGLKGIPRIELPKFFPTLTSGLHYLIPIGVLVYKLVVLRHTPESSAFLAISTLAVLIVVQELLRAVRKGAGRNAALRNGIALIGSSLAGGARNMTGVAIATASAGIIIGVMTMGPGGMVNEAVERLSGGSIMLLLLITMLASLVLGMGLPTTANYIVMASLTAPIIVSVGSNLGLEVPLIAAHMFVFYFGICADITPPVALAAFASAGIARSDPLKTGFQAFWYALPTFVLPFMFIFNHDLLLVGVDHWWEAVVVAGTGMIAAISLASILQGWLLTRLKWYEGAMLAISVVLLYRPYLTSNVLGLGSKWGAYGIAILLWGGVWFMQRVRRTGPKAT
ncbi:MAG: TRAP transporter permease [Calditrichaeota bacterium]|nr:TRAP transporter permease [Calditrichota bacterium]